MSSFPNVCIRRRQRLESSSCAQRPTSNPVNVWMQRTRSAAARRHVPPSQRLVPDGNDPRSSLLLNRRAGTASETSVSSSPRRRHGTGSENTHSHSHSNGGHSHSHSINTVEHYQQLFVAVDRARQWGWTVDTYAAAGGGRNIAFFVPPTAPPPSTGWTCETNANPEQSLPPPPNQVDAACTQRRLERLFRCR